MVSIIVSGGQWGDEGKAKITDLLSEYADYIVRYQGGANAGHTVSIDNNVYKFHLIPSGILFPNKLCIIGPGTVIEPKILLKELREFTGVVPDIHNVYISGLAHVTMPWHVYIDQASDTVGSTGKGIGPTYTDKAKRTGIKIIDLLDPDILRAKLSVIIPKQNETLQKLHESTTQFELDSVLDEYLDYGEQLRPFVRDTVTELYNANRQRKNILYEGAQGTLLDITFGTYPYVTSSTPISGGACIGAGVGPTTIGHALGVFKSFITRVGHGPFPSELDCDGDLAAQLRQDHTQWAEYGTTTGRMRRVGWFDAVLARYAVKINTYTSIALTKLDTLDQFEKIYICTKYKHKETGEQIHEIPYVDGDYLSMYEPVLTEVDGWQSSTFGVTSWDALPQNAQNYVRLLENMLETPVSIISTGPNRTDSIIRKDVFSC